MLPQLLHVLLQGVFHLRLDHFRWVIPAGGHTKLKLLFSSQDEGQFDQTLNFEISGTRRRYQLFCRGLSVVPTICREPRIVFPHRKKILKEKEIVQKKYVLSESAFMFGPLCCGKTRERWAIETLHSSHPALAYLLSYYLEMIKDGICKSVCN